MTPLYSIAVVWLFTYALCEDFCKKANFFGGAHTTFAKTPRPRDSPVLSGHNLNKRSTDPDGETCKSLTGFESTLKNNTHTYAFNDLSGSVSLAWVGDGTGVLLVLTTFQVPVFMIRLGQSKLYRSEDYGKTFQDVTHLINNTFVQTEFGIAIGPDNSGRVIMTGDVSEGGGSRIFRSLDYGHSFSPADLPFFPLIQTLYNPNDSNVLLTLSITLELWLSEDFGSTWRKIHDSVCLVRWGPEDSIYFTTNSNGSCNDKGMLELKRSLDYGKNIKTIASKIYSFVLGGCFVFASIMTGSGTQRMIHVSVDGGDVWNMAQLPTVGHEQFYSILAASDDMVFMHVDEPGGSVGDPASVLSPDVYVSDDGGYSWLRALTGPHHYAILDSGGLLVAVEHTSAPVNQIKFSTDEGQCWHVYNFTSEPLYFTGLALEPGAHSMNLSLWGYRVGLQGPLSHYWVSVTIDFKQLLSRDCGEGDYVQWLAHSDDLNNPNDGCILGYKERFLRLRKDSVCWNGRDYVITTQPTPCPCTLDDYQCDYGYYRAENSSECVEQADLKGHVLEFCLHGTTEQLQTSGYRKIPGDRCEGGIQPKRKEIDLRRNCISNALHPKPLTEANLLSSASIVVVVMVILLISAATGVMLVKKYVCGGRFLVHRYSVLQQHAEANGIEGVDELDAHTTEMGKTHYHEDSDEDLLE
ncbi:sortilin-like isoform X2 [Salvelinus namaycush]|uniref:Sortilin-like isoform X2 n=1 Tax=Salvelinus namaycush TaxID=8040 RepID=A0A8U1F9F0_SALNM|nr:sortilin-like isoform X2 [Salvelinus namaycush]